MATISARQTIGIIGCGNMGQAIVASLHACRRAARARVIVYDCDTARSTALARRYKAACAHTARELCTRANIIILAVKPQHIQNVTEEIAPALSPRVLIISILAGTTMTRLERLLGKTTRIVRSMPNLGLTAGRGMTVLCKNRCASIRDLATAEAIFACGGTTLRMPERLFDVCTAISGSGPAYFYYFIELLINEGLRRGLSRREATLLASQTAAGAVAVLESSGAPPEALRARVTSKGGTTEAALDVLSSYAFRQLFAQAVQKAIERAGELRS